MIVRVVFASAAKKQNAADAKHVLVLRKKKIVSLFCIQ